MPARIAASRPRRCSATACCRCRVAVGTRWPTSCRRAVRAMRASATTRSRGGFVGSGWTSAPFSCDTSRSAANSHSGSTAGPSPSDAGGRLQALPVVGPPGGVALGEVVVVAPQACGPVDRLADDVGMTRMAVRLGDHVEHQPVQRDLVLTLGPPWHPPQRRGGPAPPGCCRCSPTLAGTTRRCPRATHLASPTCRRWALLPRRTREAVR